MLTKRPKIRPYEIGLRKASEVMPRPDCEPGFRELGGRPKDVSTIWPAYTNQKAAVLQLFFYNGTRKRPV